MDMFADLLARGGLSLDRLRNFCLIADAGGIAKASGGDPGKQSLYARQIKELEAFFGVELTRRRGKGIELTSAGRELASLARSAFAGMADFKAGASGKPVEVRIAGGNSIIEWFLIPRLRELGASLKGIRIQLLDLRTAEVIQGLVEHTVDIGVVRNTAVTAPLQFRFAQEIGYNLFVPKRLASRRQDITSLPLALSLGGEFHERVTALAARAKLPLDVRWRCTSFTQAARIVAEGVGAAILPEIATSRLPGIESIELPWLASYRRKMGFAWHQRLADIRPRTMELVKGLCGG